MGYSWTQAICNKCNGDRSVVSLSPEFREIEQCAYCGEETMSGIYVRDDPANVKFPRLKES